jgi:hypothetical protein
MENREKNELIININNNRGGVPDKDELNYMNNTGHPGYMEALRLRDSAEKLKYFYTIFDNIIYNEGPMKNLSELSEKLRLSLKKLNLNERGLSAVLRSRIKEENYFEGIGVVSYENLNLIKERLSDEFKGITAKRY